MQKVADRINIYAAYIHIQKPGVLLVAATCLCRIHVHDSHEGAALEYKTLEESILLQYEVARDARLQ